MNFKLIDIITSISCFQLVIFSFFLIHKGRVKLSNRILALFFIVQFMVIGNFLLSNVVSNGVYLNFDLFLITLPCWFLFGPLMYFYIQSLVNKDFKFDITDTLHFIPSMAGLIFIISQYYLMDQDTRQILINNGHLLKRITTASVIQNIQVPVYNLFSLLILLRYKNNSKDCSSILKKQNLVWLKVVLYGYLLPCIITEISSFAGNLLPISYDNQLLIIYSVFLIFFNILFYKALIHPYVIIQPGEKPKYHGSHLDDSDIVAYAGKIEGFISIKKPYLNPMLTLGELSNAVGIPEKYISQVINQHRKQNFYTYINSLRVEEAKKLLKSATSSKYTMYAVAIDSGFNSRTVFYEAFKKYTGMNPTEYRNQNINSCDYS